MENQNTSCCCNGDCGCENASEKLFFGKFTYDDICRIAKNQRSILYCILANIIIPLAILGAIYLVGGTGSSILGICHLVLFIINIVFFVKLRNSLKKNTFITVLLAFLYLVPYLGLFVLITTNVTATTVLELAGLKVGLMGVCPCELEKLK